MKIGLIDVDGKHFPNLALMKLSAWHKSKGDEVSFVTIDDYDVIYKSKVFSFSPDKTSGFYTANKIILGGIGYNLFNDLPKEIEHICPDYSLYNAESAYGFLTRGCIRKCPWCIVPKKEGLIHFNSDIEEFISNKKSAILMDNNVLASEDGLKQIEKIIKLNIKIDFNQGLDARIIANDVEIVKLLSKVKWLKPLRMACDTDDQIPILEKAIKLLRKYNTTPSNYFIYVLIKDIPSGLRRIEFLRKLNVDPFAQPYIDFTNNYKVNPELKKFARWVNMKAIFKTVKWKNYK